MTSMSKRARRLVAVAAVIASGLSIGGATGSVSASDGASDPAPSISLVDDVHDGVARMMRSGIRW